MWQEWTSDAGAAVAHEQLGVHAVTLPTNENDNIQLRHNHFSAVSQ